MTREVSHSRLNLNDPYNPVSSSHDHRGLVLDIKLEVLGLIDETLGLNGRTASFTLDTALLGAIPELDSMAVVALINCLEERFGIFADDDEIDGSTFATVGTLVSFVESKLVN